MLLHLFLESVPLLIAVLVPIQLVLIGHWSWRRSKATRRAMQAGFAALPILLVTSLAFETRRENVIALCRMLAEAVEAGDVVTIANHLADDLEVRGLDREMLMNRLTERLERTHVQDASLRGFTVTFAGAQGTAEFTARATVRDPDLSYQWIISRWRLVLRPAGETWEISRLESLPVPPLNLDVTSWLR